MRSRPPWLPNAVTEGARRPMFISKMSIPRRTFLRGAGVTLALPFLNAMVPALSAMGGGGAAKAAEPVRRMGALYVPNGVNIAQWLAKGEGKNFDFSPTLLPLEPVRDYVTILSGLDSDPGESWNGGNGDHARVQPAGLAATHPKKAEAVVRCGATIDQIIAEALGNDPPLRSPEPQM